MRPVHIFLPLSVASVAWGVPVCSGSTGSYVAAGWYTGWHSQYLPIESISWSKYSAMSYAFALTTPDPSMIELQDSDMDLLPKFVEAAHANNAKALLTVGGWTGSKYFSTAVASPENRTAFATAVMELVDRYNLDGVDFDWEYPNRQGLGCNIISEQDTPNFLSFLQELRSRDSAQNVTLTAASSIVPFAAADGSPSSDVSGFASVLDYLTIMDYDVWGSWSSVVGPDAPLNDTCAPSEYQQGSAVSAVRAWTAAGFPSKQLILGVASYGHSYRVPKSDAYADAQSTTLAAFPAFDKSQQPMGDSWDENSPAGVDECGNLGSGGPSGVFNFRGLIDEGLLATNGTVQSTVPYRFDECSQTPFIYNPDTETMISYDDPTSFAAKGTFIVESGLAGFAMWEAAGDYNDLLLDAVSSALGTAENCPSPISLVL